MCGGAVERGLHAGRLDGASPAGLTPASPKPLLCLSSSSSFIHFFLPSSHSSLPLPSSSFSSSLSPLLFLSPLPSSPKLSSFFSTLRPTERRMFPAFSQVPTQQNRRDTTATAAPQTSPPHVSIARTASAFSRTLSPRRFRRFRLNLAGIFPRIHAGVRRPELEAHVLPEPGGGHDAVGASQHRVLPRRRVHGTRRQG